MTANKTPKELWIEALESGEYEQTNGLLHIECEDGTNKYCCLGVLCDVYQKNVGGLNVEKFPHFADKAVRYSEQFARLPYEVVNWVGLRNSGGTPKVCSQYNNTCLTHLNDEENFTFLQIARILREDKEGYFVEQ